MFIAVLRFGLETPLGLANVRKQGMHPRPAPHEARVKHREGSVMEGKDCVKNAQAAAPLRGE
jgi:hypothetical protein